MIFEKYDSNLHRYGEQKSWFWAEFIGAKRSENLGKMWRDTRRETGSFLTRRPRLGLRIGGFLNIFLKSDKSAPQNTNAMVLVSGWFCLRAIQIYTGMVIKTAEFERNFPEKWADFWRNQIIKWKVEIHHNFEIIIIIILKLSSKLGTSEIIWRKVGKNVLL